MVKSNGIQGVGGFFEKKKKYGRTQKEKEKLIPRKGALSGNDAHALDLK